MHDSPVLTIERLRLAALQAFNRHKTATYVGALGVAAIGALLFGPLTVVALVVIVALIAFPGWLLAAFLLVPFLYKGGLQPYVAFDLTVGLAIPTILVGGHLLLRERGSGLPKLSLLLWSALALMIVLWVVVADDPAYGLRQATYWLALAYLPLLAAIGIARHSAYMAQFLQATLLICLPFVLWGVPVLLYSVMQPGSDFLRLFGANYIGVSRASFLVALLMIGYPGNAFPVNLRALRVLFLLAAVTVGIAAGARSPVLTFVLVAVTWILFRIVRSGDAGRALKSTVLPLGLALAVGAGLAFALFPVVLVRFRLLFEYAAGLVGIGAGGGGRSISVRIEGYRLAVELFQSNPLVGRGTGAYAVSASDHPLIFQFEYPHNLPLQFAAEFGLIGLTVFAAVLVAAFSRRLPSGSLWKTVLAVGVFLALGGLVSNGIYEYRIFWAYLLLLMAVPLVATERPPPRLSMSSGASE